MHLSIADLIVTFIMLPLETVWHVTVAWRAGDVACRILMFCRSVASGHVRQGNPWEGAFLLPKHKAQIVSSPVVFKIGVCGPKVPIYAHKETK